MCLRKLGVVCCCRPCKSLYSCVPSLPCSLSRHLCLLETERLLPPPCLLICHEVLWWNPLAGPSWQGTKVSRLLGTGQTIGRKVGEHYPIYSDVIICWGVTPLSPECLSGHLCYIMMRSVDSFIYKARHFPKPAIIGEARIQRNKFKSSWSPVYP